MRRRRQGFTLLELLVTMALFGCLAGLVMPAGTRLKARAAAVRCAGNLRQIGTATTLYAAEHEQTLPAVEPWPSKPVYSSDYGAQSLAEALGPYGVTHELLRCPSDTPGGYFLQEGSSYQWFPGANKARLAALDQSPGVPPGAGTPSKLMIAFDYSAVHGKLSNVLFADGHVAGAVGGSP